MAGALFAVNFVKHVVGTVILKRLFPQISWSPRSADRSTFDTLFHYSRVSFGITAAWLAIFNSDGILLGLVGSAAAAGVYYPGAQFMLHFRAIAYQIGTPLTTAVSHWEEIGSMTTVRTIYLKGLTYLAYISILIAVGVLFWADAFVGLWLKPEFAQAADVMKILVIGTAAMVPQMLGNAVLFGLGRHSNLLRLLVVEAAVKLTLAVMLIQSFGLIGMAMAAMIPQLALYLFAYPWIMKRVLRIPPTLTIKSLLTGGIFAVVITAPLSYLMIRLLPPDSWPEFLGGALGVASLTIGLGLVILKAEDRSQLLKLLKIWRSPDALKE
jgi:O-antigen/teichoic acid export membrane protein